jgi:hypothetical protein
MLYYPASSFFLLLSLNLGDAFEHHVVCLLNLQENQVTSLKSKGIPAEFLSSTQTTQNKNKVT